MWEEVIGRGRKLLVTRYLLFVKKGRKAVIGGWLLDKQRKACLSSSGKSHGFGPYQCGISAILENGLHEVWISIADEEFPI